MSTKEEILNRLKRSVETWNIDAARGAAKEAIAMGISPSEAIENGLGEGMVKISAEFNNGRIYLPQVLAASMAMEEALHEFESHMCGEKVHNKGVIVLGTVQGDVHEIGKHVVKAFLCGAGYLVYDLGKDVSPQEFIDKARETEAEIIGASALMTTTLICQKQIVERLNEEGIVNIKTIFGGACCTQKWVDSFGGDAYCDNGAEVAATVDKLMGRIRGG
jgi:corrinoid protein of di/trimethylamine methyltransferase